MLMYYPSSCRFSYLVGFGKRENLPGCILLLSTFQDADSEKPTKEEYAVAKYLRFHAPCKEGRFLGNSVKYFIGMILLLHPLHYYSAHLTSHIVCFTSMSFHGFIFF